MKNPSSDLQCNSCGFGEKSTKSDKTRMIYVGMGNHFCIDCFVRQMPHISAKIAERLEKIRKKTWKCKHCKKYYRSDYALWHICDKCAKQGWEYIENLDGKMKVRNWNTFLKRLKKKDKW